MLTIRNVATLRNSEDLSDSFNVIARRVRVNCAHTFIINCVII